MLAVAPDFAFQSVLFAIIAALLGTLIGGAAAYITLMSNEGHPRLPSFLIKQAVYSISGPIIAVIFSGPFYDPKVAFAIGLSLPIMLQQFAKKLAVGFDGERVEKLKKTISRAEEAVEKEPEKTRPVWDLSRAQLELYINRNLSQVRNIFWITIVVMSAGFGLVVYGVYRAFDTQLQVAVLTAASGLITQTIGATFLLIYLSTMRQASDYVGTLERINAVGMAVAIVDLIPDESREAKTKARVDLVKQILAGLAHRTAPKRDD
jgi:hypothetical protein